MLKNIWRGAGPEDQDRGDGIAPSTVHTDLQDIVPRTGLENARLAAALDAYDLKFEEQIDGDTILPSQPADASVANASVLLEPHPLPNNSAPAARPAPATAERPVPAAPQPEAPPVKPREEDPNLAASSFVHVGPGIRMKAEIEQCGLLQVEGEVSGAIVAKQMLISGAGAFSGTAAVNEAEIAGRFEGTLKVTGSLFVRSTGRIVGTFSYGEIEIERGGQIAGDIGKDRAPSEAQAVRPAVPERTLQTHPAASSELVRMEAKSPAEIEKAKSVLEGSKNSPVPSRLGWKK